MSKISDFLSLVVIAILIAGAIAGLEGLSYGCTMVKCGGDSPVYGGKLGWVCPGAFGGK